MRKPHQIIATICLVTFFGMPSYAAADEVVFGSTEDYAPIWYNNQPGEHLRWVRSGDEWFHTHPDGERLYQQTFDWVGPFSEGLAPVRKDRREFHIRMDGSRAYEASYDAVGPFSMGYAPATQNGNWFHIKTDGTRAYQRNLKLVSHVSETGRAWAVDESGNTISINMTGE